MDSASGACHMDSGDVTWTVPVVPVTWTVVSVTWVDVLESSGGGDLQILGSHVTLEVGGDHQ